VTIGSAIENQMDTNWCYHIVLFYIDCILVISHPDHGHWSTPKHIGEE